MTGSAEVTEFTDRLIEICGKTHVLTGDAIEPRYRRDWLGLYESHPLYVVRPDSTQPQAPRVVRSPRGPDDAA